MNQLLLAVAICNCAIYLHYQDIPVVLASIAIEIAACKMYDNIDNEIIQLTIATAVLTMSVMVCKYLWRKLRAIIAKYKPQTVAAPRPSIPFKTTPRFTYDPITNECKWTLEHEYIGGITAKLSPKSTQECVQNKDAVTLAEEQKTVFMDRFNKLVEYYKRHRGIDITQKNESTTTKR